ncbi:ribonuclease H protein [Trifolium medium]|uniref:Ribonuclease H protein n=1 Tax=Trifolium medium TaxID=97028 RepID=A0A392NGJ8_9FABA|nr:ribonuclease H protein [Trifolium medium]
MGVWMRMVPHAMRHAFFEENSYLWVQYNIKSDARFDCALRWRDVWATACHCLWYWRNKEKHDTHYIRPTNVVHHIVQRVKDYYSSREVQHVVTQVHSTVNYIGWKPPDVGWTKLNTDGACKDMRIAGCGGLLRDNHGEWIGGLKYVWRMGFRQVELNVDSVAVVQVIREGRTHNAMGYSLVKKIQRIMSLASEVKISHSYRETNKCADALTNIGCSSVGNTVFYEDCPDQIRHLIVDDAMGITTPRLIPM